MNRGMQRIVKVLKVAIIPLAIASRAFRVFKFLKFASNLKRASIGFFCLFVFPILALFRLKAANKQTRKEQIDED